MRVKRSSVFRVKTDNDIESHGLIFFAQIETVHLGDIRMGKNNFPHFFPRCNDLLIFRVNGVDTDCRQRNMVLLIDFHLDVPDQLILLIRGICIRELYMNGSGPGIRAVVVHDQVVSALHIREIRNRLFDVPGQLCIISLTEDL